MFKLIVVVFAAVLAMAAATPGAISAYVAPAVSSYYGYGSPVAYSGYPYGYSGYSGYHGYSAYPYAYQRYY